MAVSPAEGEAKVINDVRRTYAQAEREIIEKIANRVKTGNMEIPNWQQRKLGQLDKLLQGVKRDVIADTMQGAKDDVRKAIREAYEEGMEDANKALVQGLGKESVPISGGMTGIDEESVKALSRAITGRLNDVDVRVLRTADDVYRNVVAEASRTGITGAQSRRQAAQSALNKFANRGVTAFIDRAGRSWSMQGYTEMATRSAMGRSMLNGSMNRMKQNDHDLAIVGTSYEPCPLCMPWEGRILSVTGNSKKYPSVQEAKNGGLWHPNCTHSITPYVSGVTKKPDIKEKKAQRYKDRQQQRYMERGIRKWKKRKSSAITEEAQQKAQAKVSEWEGRMRKFINKTGRYRKEGREQIGNVAR